MSTDTAFAMGALALLTPRAATRIRVFLLTLAVFDDLAGLLVIAIVYTGHVDVVALVVAISLFVLLFSLRFVAFGRTTAAVVLAIGLWLAFDRRAGDGGYGTYPGLERFHRCLLECLLRAHLRFEHAPVGV